MVQDELVDLLKYFHFQPNSLQTGSSLCHKNPLKREPWMNFKRLTWHNLLIKMCPHPPPSIRTHYHFEWISVFFLPTSSSFKILSSSATVARTPLHYYLKQVNETHPKREGTVVKQELRWYDMMIPWYKSTSSRTHFRRKYIKKWERYLFFRAFFPASLVGCFVLALLFLVNWHIGFSVFV